MEAQHATGRYLTRPSGSSSEDHRAEPQRRVDQEEDEKHGGDGTKYNRDNDTGRKRVVEVVVCGGDGDECWRRVVLTTDESR